MSWISTPFATIWPAQVGSGDDVVRIGTLRAEKAGVANRRKGTGHDWTPEQRTTLLALAGAVETETIPTDWRNPEPP